MDPTHTYKALLEQLRQTGTSSGINLIAFSGGVDSSLAAHLVFEVFPHNSKAVVGVSASMPAAQLELARQIAEHIGVPLQEIPTLEGEVDAYVANEGSSCYHCKTTLYQTMQELARAIHAEFKGNGRELVLFNGTNADDLEDPTRVGLVAAREFRVESPLKSLSKDEVRAVSRYVGLPNWAYAASPCLRSRLEYGVPANEANLQRIEAAENEVRRICKLGPQANLRVRHLGGDVAAVELDLEVLESTERYATIISNSLLFLGFSECKFRVFRSGSLSQAAEIPV